MTKFYPWIVKYVIKRTCPDNPRYLTKLPKLIKILKNFDIVIVGAGSAGCIVTNQIINNTNLKVLLIEAGPSEITLLFKFHLVME